MEFLKELGAFGVGIIMAIGVCGLFWKADEGLSKEGRADLSQWLRRQLHRHGKELDHAPPNFPAVVFAMFNKVFGERHLSKRCFFRSCLFSILSVAIITTVALQYTKLFDGFPFPLEIPFWAILLGVLFFCATWNFVPDYVSLIETRIIARLMCRTQKFHVLLGYLFADLVFTIGIFLFVGTLIYSIVLLGYLTISSGVSANFLLLFSSLRIVFSFDTLSFQGQGDYFSIFFYSTFFTSVWIWMTALGWGATRLLAKSPPLLRLINRALPIETHPMRSIGEVAAVIVCFGYWIIAAATWLMSSGEAQTAVGS